MAFQHGVDPTHKLQTPFSIIQTETSERIIWAIPETNTMSSVSSRLVRYTVIVVVMATPLRMVPAQETSTTGALKRLILPGESFLIDDRPAFILWPEEDERTNPQPWILYAPTLPGLPDQHEQWMHEQFLAAGVAVAGIDIGEAYGSPEGRAHFTALYEELTQRRGFAPKPCLLGRSRGGLMVSSWAITHPDKVAGLAGIYPVFDLQSYPGVQRAAPAYGLTPDELTARLDTLNPVSRLSILAEASVPVFLIHGDVDKVVPLEANSLALVRAYEQAGAKELTTLVVPEGQGHNFWPGFFRCEELIEFAIKAARTGATPKRATPAN